MFYWRRTTHEMYKIIDDEKVYLTIYFRGRLWDMKKMQKEILKQVDVLKEQGWHTVERCYGL